jgi:hypothetical protein
MTEIDVTQLPNITDRRDQWGRLLVVPPSGGSPVGYTRVTTVAKALDEGGGLAPWKAAMTASGIIRRKGLRARWEALLAQYGDPWYASAAAKEEAKRLVEECAAVGGANDRREVGSSLHAITALVDAGRTPAHLSDETERDVRAYRDGLDAQGVHVVPGAIETTVVLDQHRVAGTFDRLVTVPGFELPLVADLKTGGSLDYSWGAIAVQLAGYAHGEFVYEQGAARDGHEDARLPMPQVSPAWGLTMWLHDATLDLYLVDLTAGWEAFQHSMWARDWRRARPAERFVRGDMTGTLQRALDATAARDRGVGSGSTSQSQPEPAPPVQHEQEMLDVYQRDAIRTWLQHRIDTIGQENAQARAALVHAWPVDVPSLRASTEHTPEQLDAIERVVDDIEKRYTISFPTKRPDVHDEAVARVITMFPGTTIINERNTP